MCTTGLEFSAGQWPSRTSMQPKRDWRHLGEREGFPVIGLAEPLRRYADAHGAYLHGFPNTQLGRGHWNETGHRLAGEHIAAAIEAWIEADSQSDDTSRCSLSRRVGKESQPTNSASVPGPDAARVSQ